MKPWRACLSAGLCSTGIRPAQLRRRRHLAIEPIAVPSHDPTPRLPPRPRQQQVISHLVREANLQAGPQLRFEDHMTAFADCLGGCERLLRTPIPLFYTRCAERCELGAENGTA